MNFNISKNQNFIEYSELSLNYLINISKFIKINKGGLLLIDYGYTNRKMRIPCKESQIINLPIF